MVRPAQFLGPLQGYQPTLPTPSSRTLRVPTQPRAPELASDLRSSLAMHVLDHGRLLAADDPSTSPDAANALLPMSVGQNLKIGYQEFNDLQTPKLSKKQLCDRTIAITSPAPPMSSAFGSGAKPTQATGDAQAHGPPMRYKRT